MTSPHELDAAAPRAVTPGADQPEMDNSAAASTAAADGGRAVVSAAAIARLVREHAGESAEAARVLRQAQAVAFYVYLDVVQDALEQDAQPFDVPFRPTNRHWLRADLGIKTDADGELALLRRLNQIGIIRMDETETGPVLWLSPAICVTSLAAERLNWNAVGNTWVPSDYIFRLVLLDHLDPTGALTRVAKSTLLENAGMSRSALKRALSREADKEIIARAYANQNELLLAWGPRAITKTGRRRADVMSESAAATDAEVSLPRATAGDTAQTVTFTVPVRIEVPAGALVSTVGVDADGIKRYRVAMGEDGTHEELEVATDRGDDARPDDRADREAPGSGGANGPTTHRPSYGAGAPEPRMGA